MSRAVFVGRPVWERLVRPRHGAWMSALCTSPVIWASIGHVASWTHIAITDLAEQEGVTVAYVCRLLPLPCLASDIVEAVLDGCAGLGSTRSGNAAARSCVEAGRAGVWSARIRGVDDW